MTDSKTDDKSQYQSIDFDYDRVPEFDVDLTLFLRYARYCLGPTRGVKWINNLIEDMKNCIAFPSSGIPKHGYHETVLSASKAKLWTAVVGDHVKFMALIMSSDSRYYKDRLF